MTFELEIESGFICNKAYFIHDTYFVYVVQAFTILN